jgi:glutaredoxin 3
MSTRPRATLYRMELPDHVCPFGLRARDLLEANGYEIKERVLRSREEVDRFEEDQRVSTTPQIFIEGERIGGCDELEGMLAAH